MNGRLISPNFQVSPDFSPVISVVLRRYSSNQPGGFSTPYLRMVANERLAGHAPAVWIAKYLLREPGSRYVPESGLAT